MVLTFTLFTATAVFTIPENTYPLVYLRSILAVIYVAVLPGYVFIKALFPLSAKKNFEKMGMMETVVLSLVISFVLTSVTGLILNYTPWGIRLIPLTLSLLGLTLFFATFALYRQSQTKQ